MPPVTGILKPGVCPSTNFEVVRCIRKDEELCADDSECPNKEKCCSTVCGGHQCMAPVTVKPGVCPRTNFEVVSTLISIIKYSDCSNDLKCCSNGCGINMCMAPVTVKPGVCPITNEEIRCIRKDDDLCADDSECPKKQKCCSTACGGHKCTAPVTVKPGVCPIKRYKPGQCAKIRFVSCANDSDCATNLKCCNSGCGLHCLAPGTGILNY
ncbi:hypothetical protein PO909_013721 [Leuciscus waleckii]